MFGNGRIYNSLVAKGPVIGLEFAGINCVTICQQTLNNLLQTKYQNLPRKISKKKIIFSYLKKFFFVIKDFISQSPIDANGQLDKFYNFASMHMFA